MVLIYYDIIMYLALVMIMVDFKVTKGAAECYMQRQVKFLK